MPQTYGGFKKMDVTLEVKAHRAKWGVRFLDPHCLERWKDIVREWVHEVGAPWGLMDGLWTCKPFQVLRTRLQSSWMPQFWKDAVEAFWELRVDGPWQMINNNMTELMTSVHFSSVEITDHCTVHYRRTQQVPLSKYSVKLAYWCLVKQKHGLPVPKGQTRWHGMQFRVDWPVAWCSVRCDSITKKQTWRAYKLMHCVGQGFGYNYTIKYFIV